MSVVTAAARDLFAGDSKRAQILRAMRKLSDNVRVEYKPNGRSKIKFTQYENASWRAYHEFRYDLVDEWSLLTIARSFGHPTDDIAEFILRKYGVKVQS